MQAIILAAGNSSRFFPLAEGMHKSLLTIVGKTLLERTVEEVSKIVDNVVVVVSERDKKVVKELLGDKAEIAVQTNPVGFHNAVFSAKNKIKDDFFVVNADKLDASETMQKMLEQKEKTESQIVLASCKTKEPWKYGILEKENSEIKAIVEKPKEGKEPSNNKVLSIYLLPKKILSDFEVGQNEEDYFEHNSKQLFEKYKTSVVSVGKESATTKYPWDLFATGKLILEGLEASKGNNVLIGKNAVIEGKVIFADDVTVHENAVIKGPAYIGKGAMIGTNAVIRESIIEEQVMIGANAEVTRSIFMSRSSMHSGYIGDSIIGRGTKIGAGFVTANKRIDREEVKATVKDAKVPTGKRGFGIVVGHDSAIGINCESMPGTIVGSECIVGPKTQLKGTLASGTCIHSKFETVVEKRK